MRAQPSRWPTPRRSWATVVGCVAIASSIVPGCAAPALDIPSCRAKCNGDVCPNGMECRAGYCVDPEMKGYCGASGATGAGGAGNPGEAGASGLATTPAANAGTTANATGGATIGDAGASSEVAGWSGVKGGSAGAGTAAAGVSGGGAAAAGVSGGSTTAGGIGGVAGLGGEGGIATEGGGTGASQGGMGASAGQSGDCGGLSITTAVLNAACLGEQYLTTLTATCGTNCEWSATPPPDVGLTLANNGILSGVVRKTGEFELTITVRDTLTNCSVGHAFTLLINGETATACPTISISGKTSSALAPASCVAWPYSTSLAVSGGAGPYTWAATGTPPGLTFDPITHAVTGTATASGALAVQVTDGNNRTVQREFAVPLRNKCWFGYLSNESGARRLHLFDPQLGTRLQRPESNSTELSVEDFAFSPTGDFVAYRVKDASGANALWLWQAPGWDHEQALNLGGSVEQYSWSNNGLVLAAAVKTSSDTLLGGVSVAGVTASPSVSGIQGLLPLTPVPAPVESELTWYGEDKYVAFSSKYDPQYSYRIVNQASQGALGFTNVTSRDAAWYDESLSLYPSDLGVYAIDPATSILDFVAIGVGEAVFHGNVAISRDGDYVASSKDHVLNVFRATDSSDIGGDTPWTTGGGCSTLLGWSPNAERLACIDDATGLVRIHAFSKSNEPISSAELLESSDYASGSWNGSRRAFSPSGDLIALTTTDRVYLGDLSRSPPEVTWWSALAGSAAPTELSFSPNGQLLLLHRGTAILLYDTLSTGVGFNLGSTGISPDDCQESQLAISSWCGSIRALSQPVWSRDSQLLEFVRDDQNMVILDLRSHPVLTSTDVVQVVANCGVGCIGSGLFQP